MYSASICFPLPLSPVRRMVAFPCAARDATSSRSVIDRAVLSTIPFVSPIWSASAWFTRTSCLLERRRFTAASRRPKSAGFWRKSAAPIRIASTAASTEPWAVRTMTSAPYPASLQERSTSIPPRPGIAKSRKITSYSLRDAMSSASSPSRASSAKCPQWRIRSASARRIESSSSTTRTLAFMTPRSRSLPFGKQAHEPRAALGVIPRADASSHQREVRPRDVESEPEPPLPGVGAGPALLEALENPLALMLREPRPVVAHDQHLTVPPAIQGDLDRGPVRRIARGVLEQIGDDLRQLIP